MSQIDFNNGPNIFHPEKASAVGSRNSLNRDGRDEYSEAKVLSDEEVDKILNHIHSKLPPEVLSRLHVGGNVKELLHNYYNQSFQNMYNRYITTVEDELAKKFRNLVDKEEFESLNRYTPKEISKILTQIGGDDKFNSAETEKSIVNIYGHLQGHVQRGVYDLEHTTNSLLRQKTDVGAFVRGENSYSVIKCSVSDNYYRPETVSTINLAINITSEELISPIFHHQTLTESILKELVLEKIHENIDAEIDQLNASLLDEGKEELTNDAKIFERINNLDKFVGDAEDPNSARYSIVAKRFFDALGEASGKDEKKGNDDFSTKNYIIDSINKENIRNRGFNTALNTICNILDTSRMGYQYIENFKNVRKAVISEYKKNFSNDSPDESYNITIENVDPYLLREKRLAYQQQLIEFENEIDKLDKVVESVYSAYYLKEKGNTDFDTFYEKTLKPDSGSNNEEEDSEDEESLWNGLTFIFPEKSVQEEQFPSYKVEFLTFEKKINHFKSKISKAYSSEFTEERIALEERVAFMEKAIRNFYSSYNPFHCNPGLVISLDILTIKKKLKTMKGMSNVLNEFLYGLSKGFSDKAFASFSRRRSTDSTLTAEEWKTVSPSKTSTTDSGIEGVAEL